MRKTRRQKGGSKSSNWCQIPLDPSSSCLANTGRISAKQPPLPHASANSLGNHRLASRGVRLLSYCFMTNSLAPQEEATIRAFIVSARRERILELLPIPKRRGSITNSLAHPNPSWFDPRFVRVIPSSQQTPQLIAELLHSRGAGDKCWVISEDHQLDAREFEFDSILRQIVGYGMGTILCCIPGKLAYVESEDGRFILQK
jgi:hypothetical protein